MKFILLSSGLLCSLSSFCSLERSASGARAFSTASSGILFNDAWAPSNNAAAMSFCHKRTIAFASTQLYLPSKLRSNSASILFNHTGLQLGLHLQHTGFHAYSENIIQISLSRQLLENLSAGLAMHNALIVCSGYSARFTVIPEISLYAPLGKQSVLAARFYNPAQQRIRSSLDDRITSMANLAYLYKLDKHVSCLAEIELEMLGGPALSAGMEYSPADSVMLRAGYKTRENIIQGGLGYQWKQSQIELGFAFHPYLGWSGCVSLSFGL